MRSCCCAIIDSDVIGSLNDRMRQGVFALFTSSGICRVITKQDDDMKVIDWLLKLIILLLESMKLNGSSTFFLASA